MSVETIIKAGGGPSKIGRQLRLHHASVIERREAGQVPVAHVLKLEEITGIPRRELRPNIHSSPVSDVPDGIMSPPDPAP